MDSQRLVNKMNWIKQNILKIGLVILGLVLCYTLFLFFEARHLSAANAEQVVAAHNQIAALSHTIQENESTWSRLTEEHNDQLAQLQARNNDLATLISSRNEQIATLTNVVANFHPIHIVAEGPAATQTTEEERLRVDFDQTHSDYLHVHGHTLTNPAYAEVDMEFTRPLHLTITSTQTEDGAWRTYATSDYQDLQIGDIDASINPHVAAASVMEHQTHHEWYDGFEIGINAAIGTSGHSGGAGLMLGYDFGPATVGITGMGIVNPSGGDILIGLYGTLNPFDL